MLAFALISKHTQLGLHMLELTIYIQFEEKNTVDLKILGNSGTGNIYTLYVTGLKLQTQ